MKISFNPMSIVENTEINSKVDFVKKYGNYSANYNDLTPLGEQKKVWFYFVLILSLILTAILFNKSKDEKDSNGQVIEPSTTKKIYKMLAYLFLGISIILIFYNIFFKIYQPFLHQHLLQLKVGLMFQ